MQGKREEGDRPEIYSQTEDAVLKVAAEFFGDVLLPHLGIHEKPEGIPPTEMVHLEIKKMYEDFNFRMEEKRWYHFEFESDDITLDDLKRFREYEAVTSRTFGVAVTTFVLCSGKSENQLSEFTEGLNTYRVKVLRLKDTWAEDIFGGLEAKGKGAVGRADLVPMLLTPLMGGDMPEKERVLRGFSWLKESYPDVTKEEDLKMQAVLYSLACKVLAKDELSEVKEAVGMTLLGQMLMEDGIKKGREQGLTQGREQGLTQGREQGLTQGREQGIGALITTCRELGLGYEETVGKVKKNFDLSDGAAQGYLDRFWN